MKANRRRQVYIQDSFQRRFVIQYCGIVLLGCVAFGVLLYAYSSRTLTTAFVHSRLRVMSTANFLLPALGFTTVIVIAGVSLMAVIRILILSHRISGPLYRMERSARSMGEGNLNERIRLREGDELQNFAKAFDLALGELRERIAKVGAQCDRMGRLMVELREKTGASPELLDKLEDAHAQMDEAISRFKV